jgi:multidrug efflux system membrane fusion protein
VAKVFCFFFSKKKTFLSSLPHAAKRAPGLRPKHAQIAGLPNKPGGLAHPPPGPEELRPLARAARLKLLALLSAALLASASSVAQTQAGPGAPPPVTIGRAARQDVPVYATGLGTVQAYQSVLVRARVDGTLERIAFTEGQDVKPGDLLAVIDPRPYAALLAQAQAKRAADQAMLQNNKLDLARYASLARTNFASRQQLDTQQATVAQTTANLQGDEAAEATASLNLSFCNITSPIEGVVGLRQVDVGNLVHSTDTGGIVTITQVEPISVVFTLPEEQLPAVRAAMAAGGTQGGASGGAAGVAHGHAPPVEAFTSDGGTKLSEGTLLTPSNTIDATTATIALKATFANTDRKLWPGQFVSARIQLDVLHDAVTVPAPAVQHGPDGLYVFLVKPDHTAVMQKVSLGYQGEGRVVITSGLQGGEDVITDGMVRVQSGQKVDAKAGPKA